MKAHSLRTKWLFGWNRGCEEDSQEGRPERGSEGRIRRGFALSACQLDRERPGEPLKDSKQGIDTLRWVISELQQQRIEKGE